MLFFPNAKINLGLNVVGKRPDGYHDIETVFYPIGLKDGLEVIENGSFGLNISFSGLETSGEPENNLVVKAYRLLQAEYDLPGVDIHLHKVIPYGAGLGGGSADAAFMLKGVNDFFNLGLSIGDLMLFAAELGADCPFFIENNPSYASGIGDVLEPVNIDLSGWKLVLIKPATHVSTADAYANVVPNLPLIAIKDIIDKPVKKWNNSLVNDFERSVFPKHREIEGLKDKLLQCGAVYASMSGSGSSVFGLFTSDVEIDKSMFAEGMFFWEEIL